MAKLVFKNSGNSKTRDVVDLKPGINRLGRGPSNDHQILSASVSEFHCEIVVQNDSVFVRDLNSTNGTKIDGKPVTESSIYSGQTLQLGELEMILEAVIVTVGLPELPKADAPKPSRILMPDGYDACLNHAERHAIWECTDCGRFYCDYCVRKLRRVGGKHLKLCPACSYPCKLSPWSESMKGKKKSAIGELVTRITSSLKRTVRLGASKEGSGRKKRKP